MARPKINIDPEQVEKLARMKCTLREMAEFMGCNEKTLRNRFSAEIRKGGAQGKISLRRMQWKSAENGSTAMLIWLGKQYLDQKDRIDNTSSADDLKSALETLIDRLPS